MFYNTYDMRIVALSFTKENGGGVKTALIVIHNTGQTI